MDKIELIKEAIEKALNRQSKLDEAAMSVPGLMSLNIRHLLNNFGAISTIVCDHGSHVGGSFCSMVYKNTNIKHAISIDSWLSDETEGNTFEADFRQNATKCVPATTTLQVVKRDSFEVDLNDLPKDIDLYYFDGTHSEEHQCRALTYYLPAMAETFMYCVDDYMLPEVKEGTARGLKETGVEILFEQEFVTDHEYDNETFWRGWKVFLLKKR